MSDRRIYIILAGLCMLNLIAFARVIEMVLGSIVLLGYVVASYVLALHGVHLLICGSYCGR